MLSPHLSPSLRGSGLKYQDNRQYAFSTSVALFTRAWIEILPSFFPCFVSYVALFTRAWIEISLPFGLSYCFESPSLRGRGLKFRTPSLGICTVTCRPLYEGVDWNVLQKLSAKTARESPSLRGRGLKSLYIPSSEIYIASRPLYEGVDWNNISFYYYFPPFIVALFTRAWIEISCPVGCLIVLRVALFTRAWIEINLWQADGNEGDCRPLYEGVDWNFVLIIINSICSASPSLRGRGLKLMQMKKNQ